jgi:hypothetical protein
MTNCGVFVEKCNEINDGLFVCFFFFRWERGSGHQLVVIAQLVLCWFRFNWAAGQCDRINGAICRVKKYIWDLGFVLTMRGRRDESTTNKHHFLFLVINEVRMFEWVVLNY